MGLVSDFQPAFDIKNMDVPIWIKQGIFQIFFISFKKSAWKCVVMHK